MKIKMKDSHSPTFLATSKVVLQERGEVISEFVGKSISHILTSPERTNS